MAAHYFGSEVKETKRYRLGKVLGGTARHFLLMTATPHAGKEEDFQLFMALLDSDRFEGKVRDGARTADVSDLMRRMVKENILRFDGRPLFPERRAYTVPYELSDLEMALYGEVTDYVALEMGRAEALAAEGEGRRGNRVGFAVTVLQRRLASSPEAIFQSLCRRRRRLEDKASEVRAGQRGMPCWQRASRCESSSMTRPRTLMTTSRISTALRSRSWRSSSSTRRRVPGRLRSCSTRSRPSSAWRLWRTGYGSLRSTRSGRSWSGCSPMPRR